MAKDNFVHLHVHTDNSLLDGHGTIPELVEEVVRLGQPAIGITDHGNLHGVYDLYKAAKDAGVKPIAGIEAYFTPSHVNRFTREPSYFAEGGRNDVAGKGAYTHLTLLAENNQGLHNLYQLSLLSYTEGFYQKNRMDLELLEKYGKGIIATTGCPSGEIQTRIRLGQIDEAFKFAANLQDILGKENVYLELMDHAMSSELERSVRGTLLDFAKKLNMPLLATNDLHYVKKEHAQSHEEMLCVQTRSTMSEKPDYAGGNRFAFEGNNYYLKSRAEMEEIFGDLPEALNNTLEIAERCDITISSDATLRPTIESPDGKLSEFDFLRMQAYEGMARRLGEKAEDPTYKQRLETELEVINLKNFNGYFLVVSDFVRWAKANNVPTGAGRGCLSGDTRVITDAGSKNIKDIKPGDKVYDMSGILREVPEVFEYDCEEPLIKITVESGLSNKMTSDHKVLVKQLDALTWKQAKEVKVSDTLVLPNLVHGGYHEYRVTNVSQVPAEEKVYDFTVPVAHSYVTDAYVVHNSAGGSLLAYVLDITDINPLKYDLLFERFINPERDSPPDIDMDFNDTDRERVIEYVKQKYGEDKVAQIVTFGKIGAKAAIKDAVRILEQPYALGDQLSKSLPEPVAGHAITLAEVYDKNAARYPEAEEFRNLVKKINAESIIEVARGFEGRTRSTGVHAAALVISTKPIADTVPMMQRQADGAMITQWDYPTCESLGLLKVDFLGLRNLGVIANAVKNVERTRGIKLNLEEIVQGDMDDQKTYDLLARGDSLGVFQLDSQGLRGLMRAMKPTSFNDISALIALYRPGPMGVNAHNDYAARKNGLQEITPIHPELEESLKDIIGDTYNLVIYQEEIMLIAQRVAGYTLAQADNLRRAMGKKKKSVLDAEYVPFSEGMKKNGYSAEAIKTLWDILVPFADYGFNKCVSDKTVIRMSDGSSKSIRDIYNMHKNGEEIYVQSMWADGEVKPHKVAKVVSTGMKEVYRLKTQDGRTIDLTAEHRLLTTRGYLELKDIVAGQDELIVADKIYSERQIENARNNIRKAHSLELTEAQIEARRATMSSWNSSDAPEKIAQNERASERMKKYQAGLSFEERSRLQKEINATTDRGTRAAAIMGSKRAELWETDEDFRRKVVAHLAKVRRDGYNTGSGFGKTCYASNGMQCDSLNEKRMAEFLIENGIQFEMHKLVGKGECDFYFEGIYWEMDGMDRHISYFENKYGDIPFVVVTPEDYQERIATILNLEHVRNGDLVVSITKLDKKLPTIDIEMAPNGPKNYLTWKGIVSHNSHSVGYGVLSYLTAYLKANYPAEFMAALLTSVADDTDKTALYLDDCRSMGITVSPPDINLSDVDYTPASETQIVFGLRAIRGIGEGAAAEIVDARSKAGKFKNLMHFINVAPKSLVNKRILEALALGGCFDSVGEHRKSLVEAIPDMLKEYTKFAKKQAKAADAGNSLFADDAEKFSFPIPDTGEFPKLDKLKRERHALGLYISGHPVDGLDIKAFSSGKILDFLEENIKPIEGWAPKDATPQKVAGIVTSLQKKRTKKGETFAIGTIEDLSGTMQFLMFPKAFQKYGEFLQLDGIYQMQGFSRKRDVDGISFNVDVIRPLEFNDSGKLAVRLKLTAQQWEAGKDMLLNRLQRHIHVGEGSTNIIVSIKNLEGDVWEEQLEITVKPSPALTQEVRELFGMLSIGRWRKSS